MIPCAHTSTSSAASAASHSQQAGLDSKPSASRRSTPTQAQSSESTGQESQTTETCEQFLLFDATSLPAAFPASRFPVPGSDEARRTTASSGRQCATLLDDASLLGCLVKMCLESSEWNSTVCNLIWKASGFGRQRLLFQLVPLTPDTGGIEFGLWPTPCGGSDHWGGTWAEIGGTCNPLRNLAIGKQPINPQHWEWLMGYPLGWTALNASETPSSRRLRIKSSKTSPS